MTLKEWIEYHGALCRDRELLHAMRVETYKLDAILGDVQDVLRVAIGEQQQEDHPVVAGLRRTIESLEDSARLYYRADGTAEKMGSSWAVTERRKADARDLALLRARVRELEALVPEPPSLDDVRRQDEPLPPTPVTEPAPATPLDAPFPF